MQNGKINPLKISSEMHHINTLQQAYCKNIHWRASKPIDVLCQANVRNARSIVREKVYVWLQNKCVHRCLVVLWQHCNVIRPAAAQFNVLWLAHTQQSRDFLSNLTCRSRLPNSQQPKILCRNYWLIKDSSLKIFND